jgi:hypothetical protein
MLTPTDTRRAHTIARGLASPATPYRVAYAIGCAHVATSNRTTATATPTRHALAAWALAARLTMAAWLTMPAIAAAAH